VQLNMRKLNKQSSSIVEQMAHEQVLEAVLSLPQIKDKTLLHLSVVGSRSKQIASQDSDYDVKAVILHSHADYLLQNITPSKSFVTTIVDPNTGEEVEVEGTLVDYLTMQKYALGSTLAAYESLYGLAIYKTPESDFLQELFRKAYNPAVLVASFQGLGKAELTKAEKKHGQKGYIKHAANMVYYASAVHAICNSTQPPTPNAFALLDGLDEAPTKLQEEIRSLYLQRKANKSASNVNMEPFTSFLESARELKAPKRTNEQLQLLLREEANEAFLKVVMSGNLKQQHSSGSHKGKLAN
jgi:predicted nucleotidyltransferase